MADSPLLTLPLLGNQQSGAETTHNNSLFHLEVVAGRKIIDRDLLTPPGSPTDGDAYIIGSPAAGDWTGKEDDVAFRMSGVWVEKTIVTGVRLYLVDENTDVIWDGSAWIATDGEKTLTDGATINWNTKDARSSKVTLGGNRTLAAPTNLQKGWSYLIQVFQDGTGTRLLTWNAIFHFAAGTAPTLTTTAAAVDLLVFYYNGTSLLETTRTLDVKAV